MPEGEERISLGINLQNGKSHRPDMNVAPAVLIIIAQSSLGAHLFIYDDHRVIDFTLYDRKISLLSPPSEQPNPPRIVITIIGCF